MSTESPFRHRLIGLGIAVTAVVLGTFGAPAALAADVGSTTTTASPFGTTAPTTTTTTPQVLNRAAIADPASAALDWLARELTDNGYAMPSGFGGDDWGLTVDAALGLVSGGRGQSTAATQTTANVMANAGDFITGQSFGLPGDISAGPAAKVLLLAELEGVDTGSIAGRDLEATTRGLMQKSGAQAGRFSDVGASGDNSNGFGQAIAILALARTTKGVPSAAIGFLLAQQCPSGGFRLFYAATASDHAGCASNDEADTDASALAVQALLATPQTPKTSAAVTKSLDWLAAGQGSDGSFSGTGATASPNSNTTGLAGATFHDTGNAGVAAKAATWLESVQLTATDPSQSAAWADAGALAYDPAARDAAIAGGVAPETRDQFRRATAQAVLGLGLASYATAGGFSPPAFSVAGSGSNTHPEPGDSITVHGNGFLNDESVTATLHSDSIALGTKTASAGAVDFTVKLPVNLAAGSHTITLTGQVSGATATVDLTVAATSTTTSTTTSAPTTSTTASATTTTAKSPDAPVTSTPAASGSSGALPFTGGGGAGLVAGLGALLAGAIALKLGRRR